MGLATPAVSLPPSTNFGSTGLTPRTQWAGQIGDLIEEIRLDHGFTTDQLIGTSHESRLKRLEALTEVPASLFGCVADGVTDNSTAIQTALNFTGLFGGGIVKLPKGNVRYVTTLTNSVSNVRLYGRGTETTRLTYDGSGAGVAGIDFHGVDNGSIGLPNLYEGCIEHVGLAEFTFWNDGTSDSIGFDILAVRNCIEVGVAYVGWRRCARRGRDYWNSEAWDCSYDFCASVDDSDKPVLNYSGLVNGEWACDAIIEVRGRFENNGDRILDARPANGHNVNKYTMFDCKVECSVEQMGGGALTGTAFYVEGASGFVFLAGNVVLQNMRAGHAVLVQMFWLKNCYNCRVETLIAFASNPTFPKCWDSFFTLDGGAGIIIACGLNAGNSNQYPTTVFRFVNNPQRVDISRTMWGFYPTGATDPAPPTRHRGTMPSRLDYDNAVQHSFNTTDPGLPQLALVQPTGNCGLATSIVSGRLQVAAIAATDSNEYRAVFPVPKAGVMGDSEVISTWHTNSPALLAAVGGDKHQPGHAHRITSHKQEVFRGVATAGAAASITATGTPFVVDQFAGADGFEDQHYVTITGGTGLGQTKRIIDNTTSVITVDSNWTTPPDATSKFQVWKRNTRCITLTKNIAFSAHWLFNVHFWEGTAFSGIAQFDLSGYLNPGGTLVALPWHVKTRVIGRTLDMAVWKDGDPETKYGHTGRSGTTTLPEGFDAPGMSGLYVGHYDAAQFIQFEDLMVRELV